MPREQFQSLTEPMYYILMSLQDECCGVDIMEKVRGLSGGRVQVGPGTLYALLAKFQEGDMIEETRQEGRKKWYRITEKGNILVQDSILLPILLIEHGGYSNMYMDSIKYNEITQVNRASRKAYEQIQSEGIKDVYYLSREDLNIPSGGWVDYVHPSDFGMQQQAAAVERKVREILHIPLGSLTTTIPVTQRREPNMYEWQARHRAFLEQVRNHPPKAVILGNSITHYWGGEPEHRNKNGREAWEKVMRPAGFQNLGCGWDRIENVLWRVYHGELDGYKAGKVVLMIGTNNCGLNSDRDIVEGLRFLLSAIRQRQPEASVKVIGILPRRNQEQWVRNINFDIKEMVETEGYEFANPGTALLLQDGKIDESLFIGDGLHPNNRGYELIAGEIASSNKSF